jgi:hypothetical protein
MILVIGAFVGAAAALLGFDYYMRRYPHVNTPEHQLDNNYDDYTTTSDDDDGERKRREIKNNSVHTVYSYV